MTKQIRLLAAVFLVALSVFAVSGCAPKNKDQGTTISGDAEQLKQGQLVEMNRLKENSHFDGKAKTAAISAVERGKEMAIRNAPPPPPPMH